MGEILLTNTLLPRAACNKGLCPFIPRLRRGIFIAALEGVGEGAARIWRSRGAEPARRCAGQSAEPDESRRIGGACSLVGEPNGRERVESGWLWARPGAAWRPPQRAKSQQSAAAKKRKASRITGERTAGGNNSITAHPRAGNGRQTNGSRFGFWNQYGERTAGRNNSITAHSRAGNGRQTNGSRLGFWNPDKGCENPRRRGESSAAGAVYAMGAYSG